MKQKLAPNAELDLLTADELEQKLKVATAELRSGFSRDAQYWTDTQSTKLDASGNSGIPGSTNNPNVVHLWPVKAGYTLTLHRLYVQFEGVSFGTTYASGYIYLYRGGRIIDFANLAQGVPVLFSYGSDAPIFRQQEAVAILCSGGGHSVNMICDIQATLEALPGTLITE